MKLRQTILSIFILSVFFWQSSSGQAETIKPASPNASPEAKALLAFIYSLSGHYTLTGQHNFPVAGDLNSRFAAYYSGKTPAVWSCDFGFAKQGDKDSYLLRNNLVAQAIKQHKKGALVTLCWHAVPPTADEPVTFQPIPGADLRALASVQGRLTDQQYKDLLTAGTAVHQKWMAQVDTIAHYLKELQKAHVPVLWRPYHEMNGDWFWWGNRTGEYSTAALYRQLFDRFVNYHHLNNLIWVWSVDRPSRPGMEFASFYPGNNYLDILGLDVYGADFKQDYYQQLVAMAQGKPITLAEVGNPPSSEILEKQPKWSYWVIWAGMVRNTSKKQYEVLNSDPHLLGLDDQTYIRAINPYRKMTGMPLLSFNNAVDFSGEWSLNEENSQGGNMGIGSMPAKLTIIQHDADLSLQKVFVGEWEDDRVTNEKFLLQGKAEKPELHNVSTGSSAKLSANHDTLTIVSSQVLRYGGQNLPINTTEIWSIQNHGKTLRIVQTTTSPQGESKSVMVYDKK